MLCYFDSDSDVNLSYIEQIKNVRSLKELKNRLSVSNLEFVTSTEYNSPGIYLIEVSKVPQLWCTKTIPPSTNVLLNIPSRVIRAVKQKQIRIVILSIVEGDNFTSNEFDGYAYLNNNIKLLGLPKYSVLIVSGNLNASQQYIKWCNQNNQEELIEFVEGIEWDGKGSVDRSQDFPIFYESQKDINAVKRFNSLNRAHRPARTEHLFYLAKNNLLFDNLVSGGAWFHNSPIDPPKYLHVETYEHYTDILFQNYPRTVDVEDLINTVPNSINNIEIYKNTSLSIITESHYGQEGGMFITEKSFRPLLLGHPFMVLGQKGLLDKLKTLGFRTDFFDFEYDTIDNDRERFIKFHQILYNWYDLPINDKIVLAQKWQSIVEHNFYHYRTIDFKKQMFDIVITSSQQYFKNISTYSNR